MKQLAKDKLDRLNKHINFIFGIKLNFELIFDLKGHSTIGQCKKIAKSHYLIRLHEDLLNYYKDVYLDDVLPHEVSHGVQMELYPYKIKPHGKEWKEIVSIIKNKPYSPKDKPDFSEYFYKYKFKNQKSFKYTCSCETPHFLSLIRHNKITKKGVIYKCKKCKESLQIASF